MQFALFNLMSMNHPGEVPAEIIAATRDHVCMAEDLGFDATWFAEHHFSNASVCCSPILMAMHCAAVTRRILLGPAVVVLPLHHPLRVAQEVAMLDHASGGRTLLGFGPGHQPHEFRSFGVPIEHRYEMALEGWDIVEQALTAGRVHHLGKHYRIENTPVAARSLSGNMPPVFIATSTLKLLARGVSAGATPMFSHGHRPAAETLAPRQEILERWQAVGGSLPMPLALQRYVFVTEDTIEMRTAARGLLALIRNTRALRLEQPARDGVHLRPLPFAGEPDEDWLLAHAPIGPAAKVAACLNADIDLLQPSHFSLYMGFTGLPRAATARAIMRFGEEVLPSLRRVTAAAQAA